jgi:hypothetical protein
MNSPLSNKALIELGEILKPTFVTMLGVFSVGSVGYFAAYLLYGHNPPGKKRQNDLAEKKAIAQS